MADNILQNTLLGTLQNPKTPQLTGNSTQDLKSFTAAYHPGTIGAFQAALMSTSRLAYNDRQTQEMTQAGKEFDPSKVSGNTFGSIITNLEQNRGADISKVYGATMEGYTKSQAEIGKNVERLTAEKKSKDDELRTLKFQFPDAGINTNDSDDAIALKIKQSNEKKVVIDLFTQTFGYFDSKMSLADMNKKLIKKYNSEADYKKVKNTLELAALSDKSDVKEANDKDSYIKDLASKIYSGNIPNREIARDMINSKYPGSGDEIYGLVSDNYVSNKDEKTSGGPKF